MKRIKSIEIKSSNFFQDFKLEFSDKLNCIMGGRGTGKTTLLYFIKSALERNIEDGDNAAKVLKSNLGEGTIILEIEGIDGSCYSITKTMFEIPQPYLIPSMEFISIEKIFTDIECDFYEAGRIERIGMNSQDRLDLIDKMVKYEILDRKKDIKKIQIDLDANAHDILTVNKRISHIDDIIFQYSNIEEEFETHKAQQPLGISEAEKKEFETADTSEKTRKSEKRFFNKAIDALSSFKVRMESIDMELNEFYLSEIDDPANYDNQTLMKEGFELLKNSINNARSELSKLVNDNQQTQGKLNDVFKRLLTIQEGQQAEFVQLKQKFELNKEYINKYNSLSKSANEKLIVSKDKDDLILKRNKLKERRKSLMTTFNSLKDQIFGRRLEAIKTLNNSFNGDIVITLDFGGLKVEYNDQLRKALVGSGLQYNVLIPKITSSFSPDKFASIIENGDVESLKNISGIEELRAKAVIESLKESKEIYDLESLYCNDLPEFKLKIADDAVNLEDNYRKTDELSMGQRCTTVLPIIFAVSNNPLIIDQPEDNLDNKYITQRIHEIIRQQKENRQLIFITHNPNIPVLSSSDYNVFLNYENRNSTIEKTGNVDQVKEEIISLLEGGALAFEKRMEIYGYENN
jgi:ABC-type lipoprotein export system ATPase subunit